MAGKVIKGLSARRPPVPASGHAVIEEWMQACMPAVQPLVRRLDEMIRGALGEAQFAVKWQKAFYGLPDRGWVIELAAYHVSVNVVFLGGADLDPPPPLGTADRTRYVKVRTIAEAERPELRAWITGAARVDGWA